MASSSSSTPSWKHDVFLSFRGEDTRRNFTDLLHNKLTDFGIITFIDDQLRRGEQISPALIQAIEDSRFSIIIFSDNYASSSWCLDELSKILECVHEGKQAAFPVFYEVDPSDVRHQRRSYAEAFKKHEEASKNNLEKVVKWRGALTEASGYSGWDTRDKPHSRVINEIAVKIFNEIRRCPSTSTIGHMVGKESRINRMLTLLCLESPDVRMVGIWGMGGIGKTTIAHAIYERIFTQFEGCCFLPNVREKSQRNENLQMELLSQILKDKKLADKFVNVGVDSIRNVLHKKKVLIVLDDVDNRKQLEELVGDHDWFGPKSRIIITTRDKRLLEEKNVDVIYEIEELQRGEARKLFLQHAFKGNLLGEDFEELCDRALEYTKGNPLAITILGSFLYQRPKKEWECELKKLKESPNEDVQKVLRISFDGLKRNEKEIFLDIACFFKGKDKDYVSELLDSCDFHSATGISVLKERALITISEYDRLNMHDLIQEMGWEIVRQQFTEDPCKQSRLWVREDVEKMLALNRGGKTVQGIVLDLSTSEEVLDFNANVFTKMIQLRVLKFRGIPRSDSKGKELQDPSKMHLTGDFKFLSNNLRYLNWDGYPLKSLPPNFYPKKVFQLKMRLSRLEQLWEGKKLFPNLMYMDLSHSQYLSRTLDFSGAPKLRKINLEGCASLVEVHPSIETLENLNFLNLKNCSKLEEVAKSFHKLKPLETAYFSGCSKLRALPDGLRMSSSDLDLSGCLKLEELPKGIVESRSLKTLNLSGCEKLKKMLDDIGASLETLNLFGCSNLEELPKCTVELMSLETLNLSGCAKLKKMSYDIGIFLKTLNLFGCSNLEELPKGIGQLRCLRTVNLSGCAKLKKLSDDIGSLKYLEVLVADGSGLQEVPHSIGHLGSLKVLSLTGCKGVDISLSSSLPWPLHHLNLSDCNLQEGALPGDMSRLRLLEYLNLSGNSFITLPSLTPLNHLNILKLKNCKSLRSLTELPSCIKKVVASNCESLETFSHPSNAYAKAQFDFSKGRRMAKEYAEAQFDFSNGRRLAKEYAEAQFDFSNCGRLVKNKEESVSLKAILRGIRALPGYTSRQGKKYNALVPGSRIPNPEWFSLPIARNSIILKLPKNFLHLQRGDLLGMGYCAVIRENPSRWHSDHLWLGFANLHDKLYEMSSKSVSHLKLSFSGYDGKEPLVVKECAIRLLLHRERFGPLMIDNEKEFDAVNTTVFSPSPTFYGECWWTETMEVEYSDSNIDHDYVDGCMCEVNTLRLCIKVEGYNISDDRKANSLTQDLNESQRYVDHSRELIRTCDFSQAIELREINLEGCASLVEVHPSIETLENLNFLNLKNCSKLEEVAKSFHKLKFLERVNFSGCSELRKLPNELRMSSPKLDLSGCSKLEKLPKSIVESLKTLNLSYCAKLKKLPDNIGTSLKTLNLFGCSSLEELPKCIGEMTYLKTLNLEDCTSLVKVHPFIETLENLNSLNLKNCSKLEEVAKSFHKLKFLKSVDFSGCSELRKLPDDLRMSSLDLDLSGCSKLEELPKSIVESLKTLNLSCCVKLKKLPDDIGTSLETLDLFGCFDLEELPNAIGNLTSLKTLNLSGCAKLKKLPNNIGTSLVTLNLVGCSNLEELPEGIGQMMSLKTLNLFGCVKLKKLSNDIKNLKCLEKLVADGSGLQEVPKYISLFTSLEVLSLEGCEGVDLFLRSSLQEGGLEFRSFLRLRSLRCLNLSDCNLQEGTLPSNMSSFLCLEYLDLSGNCFITLPSLTPLVYLSILKLDSCKSLRSLTELPEGIKKLVASNCESLATIPSPPNTNAESQFDFSNCGRLVEKEDGLEAILCVIRALPQYSNGGEKRFNVIVPGSRIPNPEWFIHQRVGNSIFLKLSSDFPHPHYFHEAFPMGYCAVFGEIPSRWHSDHLWLGFANLHKMSSKPVNHLKFSFSGHDGNAPLVVKKCAIRLLYVPVPAEEYDYEEEYDDYEEVIESDNEEEFDTVNTTVFSPSPEFDEEDCCITTQEGTNPEEPIHDLLECACEFSAFNGECCWTETMEVEYSDSNIDLDYFGGCMAEAHTLKLCIKVEGYNIDVPKQIMPTSLPQDSNSYETKALATSFQEEVHERVSQLDQPLAERNDNGVSGDRDQDGVGCCFCQ